MAIWNSSLVHISSASQDPARGLSIPCASLGSGAPPQLDKEGETLLFLREEWTGYDPRHVKCRGPKSGERESILHMTYDNKLPLHLRPAAT